MKTKHTKRSVTYDSRSIKIDGKRTLLISGEIHYARLPRAEWASVLDESVACGLNTVACYIFWNWHEVERGVYDFSGDRDLAHFLQLCDDRGLNVILRAGPYCCAEWNFGGYPPYLRNEPGITIRTASEPYLDRVEKYFRHLVAEFQPFLASKGGPIVLVQVENEYLNVSKRYGRSGERYLKWLANLVLELGVDVPLIMCEGGIEEVVETLNGFSISEERIRLFRDKHPGLPMLWTELWPAWYDTWGFAKHRRDPKNIAFFILDWISRGGAGWNYYMWIGGTNLGRTSMYLQTTSYGFDAPIDEHGRPRARARYLAGLHRVLLDHADIFFNGKKNIEERKNGASRITWSHQGRSLALELSPGTKSARLLGASGKVLFDTEATYQSVVKTFSSPPWRKAVTVDSWKLWAEPFPGERDDGQRSIRPTEQLLLTQDRSDYCWYAAKLDIRKSGAQELDIPYCADVLRVYLDGDLIGQTEGSLVENRGATLPLPARKKASEVNPLEPASGCYGQQFRFEAKAGAHRIEILAASIGLIKGDWMVAGPMNTERRGIWQGVFLNGKEVLNWTMHAGLVGEKRDIAKVPRFVPWAASSPKPCAWHHASFRISEKLLRPGSVFRLDARDLEKGLLFVNGHCLGRHWLVNGHGYGADEGWHEIEINGLFIEGEGEPTQRYYKIPASWLQPTNDLVIFEEARLVPGKLTIECSSKVKNPGAFGGTGSVRSVAIHGRHGGRPSSNKSSFGVSDPRGAKPL